MSKKFEVGDKVKVVAVSKSYANGWGTYWTSNMDNFVNNGKSYEIMKVDRDKNNGYMLKDPSIFGYWFPAHVLELDQEKFIDGVAVSESEFNLRTSAPVYMTEEEVSKALGYLVKFK